MQKQTQSKLSLFDLVCQILVVLLFKLEVGLRVSAYGTHLGCLLANVDMATVRTLPNHIAVA